MKWFIPILLCCVAWCAFAANHYVVEGASGAVDGTSWTDAWTNLPSTLSRGDTYYIGDGNYGEYVFDDAESGTNLIVILKATASDHGTETGWSSAYGDGQAAWSGWNISSSYWHFNGQTRDSSWTNGYGFSVGSTNGAIGCSSDANDLTFSYIDMYGDRAVQGSECFYAASYAAANHTIQYSYLHDPFGVHIYWNDATNVTLQYSYLARNESTESYHSESVQCRDSTNLTVRFNIFDDIDGTGVIVDGSGGGTNWYIYGNVFFATTTNAVLGHGVVSDNTHGNTTGVKFYNNTIVGLNKGGIKLGDISDSDIQNNIWYDCALVEIPYELGPITFAHSNNYHSSSGFYAVYYNNQPHPGEPTVDGSFQSTITSDPFVNSANTDFRLVSALSGYDGATLGAPYNTDLTGATRASDGTWDRGAYELDVTAWPLAPDSPPNRLHIRVP